VSSLVLPQIFYRAALTLQVVFYTLGALAILKLARGPWARIADAARTFIVLNTAALVAFLKFISGREAAWGPSQGKRSRVSVQVG